MIHGSGPMDRNENMPGQSLNVFNTIAEHLAEKGIASLRYDKRGCGKSGGNYLGLVNTNLIVTVEPKKAPIKARGARFGCSK